MSLRNSERCDNGRGPLTGTSSFSTLWEMAWARLQTSLSNMRELAGGPAPPPPPAGRAAKNNAQGRGAAGGGGGNGVGAITNKPQ